MTQQKDAMTTPTRKRRSGAALLDVPSPTSAKVIDASLPVAEQIETTAIGMLLALRDQLGTLIRDVGVMGESVGELVEQARAKHVPKDLAELERVLTGRDRHATDPAARATGTAETSTGDPPPRVHAASRGAPTAPTDPRPVTGGEALRGDGVVVVDLGMGGLAVGRVIEARGTAAVAVDCGPRIGQHVVAIDRIAPVPRSVKG